MEYLIHIVLLGFICWRVTFMLTQEDGPYDIFSDLRESAKSKRWSPFHCFYCTSVWVAVPTIFATNGFFDFLAVSAIAIFIDRIHVKLT